MRLRLASLALLQIRDRSVREEAVERRQPEPRLAARERGERDEQAFPAIVVPVPGRAPHGAVAQCADRIALGIELPRRRRCVRRMQQVAILGGEQKDQAIDEAKKLAEEVAAAAVRRSAAARAAAILGVTPESRCRGSAVPPRRRRAGDRARRRPPFGPLRASVPAHSPMVGVPGCPKRLA